MTTETLTWSRDTDDEAALHAILDRLKDGDRVTVVRKRSGHIFTTGGPVSVLGKCVSLSHTIRHDDGSLSLAMKFSSVVSLTAIVTKTESAWRDAWVVMQANGSVFLDDGAWYMTGSETAFSADDLTEPVRVLVGFDGQTCLTDEEIEAIFDTLRDRMLTDEALQAVRDALAYHRQPEDAL